MSFDRIAPFYRSLETIAFGQALQRARTRWIADLSKPGRVLIVGEGDGRFLCELLRIHPGVQIDYVDASARMLRMAEARVRALFPNALSRVRFLQEDILRWTPAESYDVLVTHFVLDCFDAGALETVVRKLAHAAAPAATWLLADFSVPSLGLGNLHARLWLRVMYTFFRVTAGLRTTHLVDPTEEISAQGFVCRARDTSRLGMLKSEMWMRN